MMKLPDNYLSWQLNEAAFFCHIKISPYAFMAHRKLEQTSGCGTA